MKTLGIYIHIPFCVKKCAYCDFLSFPCSAVGTANAYFEALGREIAVKSADFNDYCVDTIFIGGGTPSLVDVKFISDLLRKIRKYYNVSENAEITIEGNPDSLTFEKMVHYRELGINRLSMGVQSLSDDVLKLLGRVHNANRAIEAFSDAGRAGFENVNMDFIFGVPGDDRKAVRETFEKLVELHPEHVSAYSLIVEEGTPIYYNIERGVLDEPDDAFDREDYYFIKKILADNGYYQYEISNFAKKGFESRHNIKYWRRNDYLGLGLGAASYIGNRRFANTSDMDAYIENPASNLREDIEMTPEEIEKEYLMLGFRMPDGPDFSEFPGDIEKYRDSFEKLIRRGLICKTSDERHPMKLTDKGLDFANEIFMEFN